MNDLKIFWLNDGGEEYWYCAETQEEALEMHLEPLTREDGIVDHDELDKIEFLETVSDSESSLPMFDEKTGKTVSKNVGELISEGKGFVAATCW